MWLTIVIQTSVLSVFIWLIGRVIRLLRYSRQLRKIPFVYRVDLPIVSDIISMTTIKGIMREGLSVTEAFYRINRGIVAGIPRNCSTYRINDDFLPMVVLRRHKDIEVLLANSVSNLDKHPVYDLTKRWLGNGLLTMKQHTRNGTPWKERRKLLNRAFHYSLYGYFADEINRQSVVFVNLLKKHVESNGQQPINVAPMLIRFALDVISGAAMGTAIQSQTEPNCKYADCVDAVREAFIVRAVVPFSRNDFIFYNLTKFGRKTAESTNYLRSYVDKIIAERRSALYEMAKETGIEERRRLPFLDLLLLSKMRDPTSLNEKDICDEVNTFLFAGHDTTSTGLVWTLFLLGLHPEVQDRVYGEVSTVLNDRIHTLENITLEDIAKMKYLDCVVKESLRIYPPVPAIERLITTLVEIDGCTIPVGTTININIFEAHRDPEIFEKPEEFNPERFYGEDARKIPTFGYIPFSSGVRNCIGQKTALMEIKILTSWIIRSFEFRSCQQRDTIRIHQDIIMKPEKMDLSFSLRK